MSNRARGGSGPIAAGLRRAAAGSLAGVGNAINEDRIRLAVTGLSRAGKTVFITSLIHNLLALGKGRDTLPKLTARLTQKGTMRLRSIKILPAGAGVMPFFDFASKLDQLASTDPAWPPRTDDLAQISLMLEIERPSAFGRRLGPQRIRLDILDYPGEWLVDLPMLDQSYAAWSAQTLAMLRTSPRLECSGDFLAFADGLHGDDRAEESLLHRGHKLYRAALAACRDQHGLRYLQPGRFVCPGPGSEAPFMWFFPFVASGASRPGSMAELLEKRYGAYLQHVRKTFFDTHFTSFDRQIMLVDVLGALFTGRAAFEDTARIIHDLGVTLRYGGAPLQKLFQRRIEKLVFVATKADHVPAMRRDNLLHLLRALTAPGTGAGAGRRADYDASVSHRVAASILSTRDGTAKSDNRVLEVVHGILLGEDKVRPYFVGDVPASLPPENFWSERFLQRPVFRPPPIDPNGATGIPHLNLDHVLDDLIGDLL